MAVIGREREKGEREGEDTVCVPQQRRPTRNMTRRMRAAAMSRETAKKKRGITHARTNSRRKTSKRGDADTDAEHGHGHGHAHERDDGKRKESRCAWAWSGCSLYAEGHTREGKDRAKVQQQQPRKSEIERERERGETTKGKLAAHSDTHTPTEDARILFRHSRGGRNLRRNSRALLFMRAQSSDASPSLPLSPLSSPPPPLELLLSDKSST